MNTDNTSENDIVDGGLTVPVSEQELLAARLTAHGLGELDAAESAEVARLLADPMQTDARSQVAEVRALAAALKATSDEDTPTRSADLRRAVLAAAAASPSTGSLTVPRRGTSRRPWGMLATLASLAAAVTVMATVFYSQSGDRQVAMHEKRNLAIDSARATAMKGTPAPADAEAAPLAAPVPATAPVAAMTPSPATVHIETLDSPPEHLTAPKMKAAELRSRTFGAERDGAMTAPGSAMPVPLAAASPVYQGQPGSRGDALAHVMPSPARRELPAAGEGYATFSENRFLVSREQPLSTFSIDVDTASYANVRRFLASGRRPPRDAVRVEELVNYFRYDYPQPDGDVPFSVTVDATQCPWNAGHRLVRIGLQGRQVDRGARPAGNLVFLVDVSGSMEAANKLPLVRQALAMLVEELTENDRVSIVTYAGNAGLVLPPTTGDQKRRILDAIESLAAGGSTHGSAGIALAYEQAREHFIPGGANRVILATDGDLNVGVTSTAALIDLIKEKAAGGTFLTVLGFGEGNLQDEKMEALADNGNGVYAYIDGVREARKVLVEQLTGSTITIAKDVKIQVEFNPARVASYRLLGYENRALAARDFRDDKKDAGEIGAGHAVTALYEIALVGEESASGGGAEPLKYQPQPEPREPAVAADASTELLTVKLRWKRPDGDTSALTEVPLADRGAAFDEAPADLRFAAAVAAFGMILRDSDQRGDATLAKVAKIAAGALGRDEGGYRAEFLDLVRRAEALE